MQDRRRHIRANVPLVATACREGGKVGDYLLRNLSAGGALLVNGPPLPAGERLDLVLQGACARPLRVVGVVVRGDVTGDREPAAAVAFRSVGQGQQDFLQNLVLTALELEREPAPTVLVFDRRSTFLAPMARDLTSLRRRVLLAMTEIEVIRYGRACPS